MIHEVNNEGFKNIPAREKSEGLVREVILLDRVCRETKNIKPRVLLTTKQKREDLTKELEEKNGYKVIGTLDEFLGMVVITSEDEIIRL